MNLRHALAGALAACALAASADEDETPAKPDP